MIISWRSLGTYYIIFRAHKMQNLTRMPIIGNTKIAHAKSCPHAQPLRGCYYCQHPECWSFELEYEQRIKHMICEYQDSCSLIQHMSNIVPFTMNMINLKYCQFNKDKCARYSLAQIFGMEIIPYNLWPSDDMGAGAGVTGAGAAWGFESGGAAGAAGGLGCRRLRHGHRDRGRRRRRRRGGLRLRRGRSGRLRRGRRRGGRGRGGRGGRRGGRHRRGGRLGLRVRRRGGGRRGGRRLRDRRRDRSRRRAGGNGRPRDRGRRRGDRRGVRPAPGTGSSFPAFSSMASTSFIRFRVGRLPPGRRRLSPAGAPPEGASGRTVSPRGSLRLRPQPPPASRR